MLPIEAGKREVHIVGMEDEGGRGGGREGGREGWLTMII
jgi:hypothetical protein